MGYGAEPVVTKDILTCSVKTEVFVGSKGLGLTIRNVSDKSRLNFIDHH